LALSVVILEGTPNLVMIRSSRKFMTTSSVALLCRNRFDPSSEIVCGFQDPLVAIT
jgi:hypothetical protein